MVARSGPQLRSSHENCVSFGKGLRSLDVCLFGGGVFVSRDRHGAQPLVPRHGYCYYYSSLLVL
eukprot:2266310-Amphidinium_carterae.1